MGKWGNYSRPIPLFEAYSDWRDQRMALVESGELEEADARYDFPSFLYGPVRQSMWYAYDRVEPQYQRYTRVENSPDFRDRRLRGLNGMSRPGYVGELGEYGQMIRSERAPASLVVDTYGGVYSMTRHLIVNDDTNELLNSAPAEMGYSAAQFIVETIIALIESNPTAPDGNPMWSTGRGNQGTLALSEDALATAIAAMTKQRDDSGRHINIKVQSLVVADPRVQLTAQVILRSTETGTAINYSGGAGAGAGIFDKGRYNALGGILPDDAVVYDPYFSDANDWYLFADPSRVPAFATGFLNGQDRPQVFLKNPEVREALGGGGQDPYTFELDSIDWKVRMDFGVAPVDPRGTWRAIVA